MGSAGWSRCPTAAVELDPIAAGKVLVSSGSYPAVISELAVANELRDGRLVEVPLIEVDLSRSLNAVWRRGTRLRTAVDHFLLTARPVAGPVPTRTPRRSATRDPRPATCDRRLSALLQRRPNGAAKAAVAWADDST